jgi:hypothetical protein
LAAVESLVQTYSALEKRAGEAGQRDFSQQAMIASFQKVYEAVLRR